MGLPIVSEVVVCVAPSGGIVAGLKDEAEMVSGDIYVNWSGEPVALVPPGVVTVMSIVPLPAGEVAVIEVAPFTVNEVASVVPNFTAVAPLRLVPVMVTLVPPTAAPADGATAVTVGTGVT